MTGITSCNKGKEKPTLRPPVRVGVIEIKKESSLKEREYSGIVSSSESTTVSFPVAGTITSLKVKEGDKVAKGQLIGQVRSGEYENAYNIAQAQLAEAQDGYDRLKKLHDANALPEVKWVEIQQKLKQAQNMAEMAKRSLQDASLHSPTSGTVTKKFAETGQTVFPAEPIYEIVSLSDLTIDVAVSESEIGNFSPGQKASVILDAFPGTLEGTVSNKDITANPLTRSYAVKVSIPNKEGKILPGMIGKVNFEGKNMIDTDGDNFTLPSQAVMLNHDNTWFVWVVKDSVAQQRFVNAGPMVADGVVIESGLQAGDLVIVEGVRKVGTGTKVIPLMQ